VKKLLFEDNFENAEICSGLVLRTSELRLGVVAMLQQILGAKFFTPTNPEIKKQRSYKWPGDEARSRDPKDKGPARVA
jgi:hypothetical protein